MTSEVNRERPLPGVAWSTRRVIQTAALALFFCTAMFGAAAMLEAKQDLALVEATELIRFAHAEARSRAAEMGTPTRLWIDGKTGSIRATATSVRSGAQSILYEGVVRGSVWLESDVYNLCFDGEGKPALYSGCEEHIGAIGVKTPTDETMLTLTPDGRLLRSGTTLPS